MKNEVDFNMDGLELVPLPPEDEAKRLILQALDEASAFVDVEDLRRGDEDELKRNVEWRQVIERGDFFSLVEMADGPVSVYDWYKGLANSELDLDPVEHERMKKIFSLLEQVRKAQ